MQRMSRGIVLKALLRRSVMESATESTFFLRQPRSEKKVSSKPAMVKRPKASRIINKRQVYTARRGRQRFSLVDWWLQRGNRSLLWSGCSMTLPVQRKRIRLNLPSG